jgi:hypothetical protein
MRRLSSGLLAVALLGSTFGGAAARADDRDLLRRGTAKPYVFILFDTSGSMAWSPRCTAEQLAAGECDTLCPSGDCFVPRNGDDPASKLYQAKEALYEVIEAADNVDFGFATYNQDELRVGAKHWLYRATEDGPSAGGVPVPAPGSVEVFGDQWRCDRASDIGCEADSPADLDDAWELDRVRRLPKGGDGFDRNRRYFVRQGGTVYEVTYRPVSGTLGGATLEVQIEVDRCSGGSCVTDVAGSPRNVTFERVAPFISWDNTPKRENPQLSYFHQADGSPATAGETCGGWEGNEDSGEDGSGGVNLKVPTTRHPQFDALDRGDMIPLDWNGDNRDRILDRLAPNRALGEAAPDFSVARYLEDTPNGAGVLELEDPLARPLFAFGATPIGNSIRDFRTWYAGCAQGACPGDTGWKDLAADEDPDWGCRRVYLLVLTDGDDTCPGADACSGTAALFAQEAVKTYVVGFGVQNTPGNRLTCMASNGGSGEPIFPQNKQELIDTLTNIFSEIQEEARSFAAAAVPTVQASVEDAIYLSHFTPLNASSLWDGHLDAFLKPLPLVPSGPEAGQPDRSRRCSGGLQSGCLAWDAGEQLLFQVEDLDLAADPPVYAMGDGALERRVFYASRDAVAPVPRDRRLFRPPPDPEDPSDPATFGPDWLELLDGMGIPPADPDAIDDARETIHHLLRPKTVTIGDPDAPGGERDLTFLLGDVFHSNPVSLGSPQNLVYFLNDAGTRTELQDGDPVQVGGYQDFALRHRVRRRMVLVGANDGQLHVFDSGRYSATVEELTRSDPDFFPCTDDDGDPVLPVPVIAEERFSVGTGHEVFSFVARGSMPNLPELPGSTAHRYSVDGTVTVGDVEIGPEERIAHPDHPDYVSAWRTLAVAGLRRGGRGYYALDVTQPDRIVERSVCTLDGVERSTAVAAPAGDGYVPSCLGDPETGDAPAAGCGPRSFPTVLWELEDTWDENLDGEPDLGDTWSVPVLGRIRVCDGVACDPALADNDIEDRWVAIFGGGFDEEAPFAGAAAGRSLYMVDVATGEVLYKQFLDGMVPSEPAAVDADLDGYLDRLYVGTTAGSLYKVDLRSVPRLRDVQVAPGPSQPLATVHRISTADGHDTAWRPFRIFGTGGRPIFFPPSAIFVAELSRFAVTFGTGDRDDLWSPDPQTGRFYAFLDTDLSRGTLGLPATVADLVEIEVTDPDLDLDDNLLVPTGGALTAGWYLELDARERLITKPFALSGVLFFTSYQPDDQPPPAGPGGGRGGGGNQDEALCARTGESRVFVVFATNANALTTLDGVRSRFLQVPDFVTDPFETLSTTGNEPGGGEGGEGEPPDRADDLCRSQGEITQQLMQLFPDSCRFAHYTLDIQTIRSDRGLVCIAPVPVCFQQRNWSGL